MSDHDATTADLRTKFRRSLRGLRETAGLSQSDLASRTGLLPSAIAHFEAGRRTPTIENLCRLADALAVTTDALLGRSPDKSGWPGCKCGKPSCFWCSW